MKQLISFLPLAALLILTAGAEPLTATPTPAPDNAAQQIERGRYLVTMAGSGTAFAGPRRLDQLSALEIGNEELFIKTVRSGRHQGMARAFLPLMPWQNLTQMTDQDLKAVHAYLQSIQPASMASK